MMTAWRSVWILFGAMLWLGVAGCGRGDLPELGQVQGKVTLNGKPLAGLEVHFFPDTGRAATAITQNDGGYRLTYNHGVMGTKVGPNTVSFAWPMGEAGTAKIPEKYGANSQVKMDVKPGRNTFDFALEK